MTSYYLDSSVALRALLGHSPSAAAWLDAVTGDEQSEVLSSRILRTELTRVLRREGLPVDRRDEVLDVLTVVPLTDGVLATAEAIVPHVKTLDAIHLASAVSSGLNPTVVTHDGGMRSVAMALGLPVLDPVTES